MHELSIALNIIDIAEKEMQRQGKGRVRAVHLRLGRLAFVVEPALRSAFELARVDSLLAGAELVIKEVPVRSFCPSCQCECEVVSTQDLSCSRCGAPTRDILSGRELEIVALEIEDDG